MSDWVPEGRLGEITLEWTSHLRASIWHLSVAYGLLEIICQQQLLTECALLQGHTWASERTGYNSVSDHLCHLYYSEDCLTRRGLDQCIILLVLVYYSSVIKLLLLLICWFLSFLLLLVSNSFLLLLALNIRYWGRIYSQSITTARRSEDTSEVHW